MRTQLLPATAENIDRAGRLLAAGQVVGFPTETVYGLGADARNAGAVAEIFRVKGRPADNPLIAHIADMQLAEELVYLTPLARLLAGLYWPGPLTMVCRRRAPLPDIVSAGLPTLALRMPAHPVAAALIRAAGTPVAAPSANRSGKPSTTTAAHVYADMAGRIPLILDGGAVEIGLESTVVDAQGEYPLLLRPGRISAEMLREACGAVGAPKAGDEQRPPAPGMKYRHYAPAGAVYLAADDAEIAALGARLRAAGGEPYYIVSDEAARALGERLGVEERHIRRLGARGDLTAAAHNIFAALREADARGEASIVVESVAEEHLGAAIMNRLHKAAAKR
ncbi:MAG: L-threonylcarbamoyladenylate synthase [Bacillota bacterium]|nr:L-threonylcarbamoyladenylate synthase [Bacillota bacterium]